MVNDSDWLEKAKAAARSAAEAVANAGKAADEKINSVRDEVLKKVVGDDYEKRYRNARIFLGTADDQDILDMMNDVDAERQALQNKNVAPCSEGSTNNLPSKASTGRRRQ